MLLQIMDHFQALGYKQKIEKIIRKLDGKVLRIQVLTSQKSIGFKTRKINIHKNSPAIKIISPRHEDIPEINNPKIRFPKLEGDKLMKEVLNGGYNVHPVPPPNSEKQERIMKRYETKRIKIEKLLPLFIIIRRQKMIREKNIRK